MMVVGLIGQTSVFIQVSLHWRGEEGVRIIDTWLKIGNDFFLDLLLITRACDMTSHRAGSQLILYKAYSHIPVSCEKT